METRTTKTKNPPADGCFAADFESETELVSQRLETLLAINRETARERELYSSPQEKFEAELLENPLSNEKTYAYFGLLLGTFPPMAFFLKALTNPGDISENFWMIGVFAIVNLIAAVVGYFSGKVVGKLVGELEKMSWTSMLLILPFLGLLWGILAGGAGGIIIFIVGAIFGAAIGGAVGAAALPAFTVFHRLLKKGDLIEGRQFLPIAFGVTFVICALILGL